MASSARIEELERKFNENPRRYFAPLANEYRKAGDLEQAIAICRTYVPQQPAHMSGHIVFGQALFEAGEHEEARGVFESALALDPENLIALRHLGDIARERGESSAARTWYQRVLDADPRNEEVLALIGSVDGAAVRAAAAEIPTWAEINPERTLELPPALLESVTREIALGDAVSTARVSVSPPTMAAPGSPFEPTLQPPPPTTPRAGWPHDTPVLADEIPGPGLVDAEPFVSESVVTHATGAEESPSSTTGDATAPTPGFEPMEFVAPARAESASAGSSAPDSAPDSASYESLPSPEAAPAVFVTETMAELYLQQGFRDEALNVYRQLLAQNPADALLRGRIEELERAGATTTVESETPAYVESMSAAYVPAERMASETYANGPTIRSFFAALASRQWTGAELPAAPGPSESDDGVSIATEPVESQSADVSTETHPATVEVRGSTPTDVTPGDATTNDATASDTVSIDGGAQEASVRPTAAADAPPSVASSWTAPPSPEPVTPEPVTPEPVTPVTHGPVAPEAVTPALGIPPALAIAPARGQGVEVDDPHTVVLEGGTYEMGSDPTGLGGFGQSVPSPLSVARTTEYDVASYDAADMFGATPSGVPAIDPPSAVAPEAITGNPPALSAVTVPSAPASQAIVDEASTRDAGPEVTAAPVVASENAVVSVSPSVSVTATAPPATDAVPSSMPAADGSSSTESGDVNGSAPGVSPRKVMQTGSVNVLFPQEPVRAADETAATTLSDAFGGPTQPGASVTGRPARPANNELSLDSIFREAGPPPEARRESSAFSFDQFFTDAAGKPVTPAPQPGTPSRDNTTSEGPDTLSTDAEQFSNWLAGLKKK